MSPIAIRLKDIREAKKLSQGELAALADTRQGTISLLESGKTRRIDLDLLERIAEALDVEPADLLVRMPKRRGPR